MSRLQEGLLGALILLGAAGCALATPPTVKVARVELRGVGVVDQAFPSDT